MNKLIIIGNGFDLAHGLKTRYSDFLVWYLDSVLNSLRQQYKFEDELIKIDEIIFSLQKKKIESIEDYRRYLEELPFIKVTHKSDFFKYLLNGLIDKKWVDIESAYFNSLVKYYTDAEKNNFSYWDTGLKSIESFHKAFEFIKSKLFEYLNSLQLLETAINTSIATKLEQIIYDPDWELTEHNKNDSVLTLNFNYTSTLKLYTQQLNVELPHNLINIHGSISQRLDSIIFGYGDEMNPYYQKIENLNSNELLRNIKSFGYLKNEDYKKFRLFTDSDKFIVYILGHSCGLSDRILLNSIFEHKNCESIKIYYHKRSDTDNDYTEKTMEISRHFGPQNKDLMRRRIVPFDKCSPLT